MIKVFAVDDGYWYAAETGAEALEAYRNDCNGWGSEDELDEPLSAHELSESDMNRLQYMCDDDQSKHISFAEQLKRMVAANDTFPGLFATSEI
jgi:hypothetical protein